MLHSGQLLNIGRQKNYIVESKSLKLYLVSYRNHGAFHEDCTIKIAKDLQKLLDPKWLRIGGYWYPRGGIPIDIFYQTGLPPKNVWIKNQNVSENLLERNVILKSISRVKFHFTTK